jgi:hypothetical protein
MPAAREPVPSDSSFLSSALAAAPRRLAGSVQLPRAGEVLMLTRSRFRENALLTIADAIDWPCASGMIRGPLRGARPFMGNPDLAPIRAIPRGDDEAGCRQR